MSDPFDQLKKDWMTSRHIGVPETPPVGKLIGLAKSNKMQSIRVQWLNIFILSLVLLGLYLFFSKVARLQESLSMVGIIFMMGGLGVRILIELFSIYKSKRIQYDHSAAQAIASFKMYFRFRKQIHGPVMVTILILYTIGFYLLTPEFSRYFDRPMMILIDLSYLPTALIYGYFIRKGIRKEMGQMEEVIHQGDMFEEEHLLSNHSY